MKHINLIKKNINSIHKRRDSVFTKYSSIKKNLDELDIQLNYYNKLLEVKPQILFNYGRDKKYVYGQMYYFESPFSSKKKSFRFMLGKMSDGLSRKKLDEKCMDVFYDKYICGWIDSSRTKS